MLWEDDIWNEMRRMQRQINRLFHGFDEPRTLSLRNALSDNYRRALMDCKEDDKNFTIAVEIPGIDKEDINLDISENSVIIKAEKKYEKEEGSKEKGDYRYAKSYAGFYQEVALPENADTENIEAVHRNGVLKLTIPKKKLAIKKKEIKIK
ncbi:MAG: Hsp20/alpha crystallin family protein [Candidatus Nanoarchaeia archaeon]